MTWVQEIQKQESYKKKLKTMAMHKYEIHLGQFSS